MKNNINDVLAWILVVSLSWITLYGLATIVAWTIKSVLTTVFE